MARKEPTHAHSIRFPLEQYEQVKALAEKERRSFNAQVIHLIGLGISHCKDDSFTQDKKLEND